MTSKPVEKYGTFFLSLAPDETYYYVEALRGGFLVIMFLCIKVVQGGSLESGLRVIITVLLILKKVRNIPSKITQPFY